MTVFNYEAKNIDGIVIKGKLEVDTKEELQKNLREKNFFLKFFCNSSLVSTSNLPFITIPSIFLAS